MSAYQRIGERSFTWWKTFHDSPIYWQNFVYSLDRSKPIDWVPLLAPYKAVITDIVYDEWGRKFDHKRHTVIFETKEDFLQFVLKWS